MYDGLMVWRRQHIGTRAQDGWTALMWAAGRGRTDCARLLLDAGADKEAKNEVLARADVPWVLCVALVARGGDQE